MEFRGTHHGVVTYTRYKIDSVPSSASEDNQLLTHVRIAVQVHNLEPEYRKDSGMPPSIESVALIGSYLPRQFSI